MYAVQQPLHTSTFEDVMGAPAWKSLPSWYLVAENDEVIPPDAERQFAQRMGADTIEVASGHCAMGSHPEETHERIGRTLSPCPGRGRARRVLTIRGTKTTGSWPEVPLTGRELAALDRLPARLDTPLLFPAPEGGPLNLKNFRPAAVEPTVKASGIDGPAQIYDLRSTFAASCSRNARWAASYGGCARHDSNVRPLPPQGIPTVLCRVARSPAIPDGYWRRGGSGVADPHR